LTICDLILTAPAPRDKRLPEESKTLGDYLKEKRIMEDIPIEVMCVELDIYTSTLHRWENNLTKLRTDSRYKIINYLGYDPTKETFKN